MHNWKQQLPLLLLVGCNLLPLSGWVVAASWSPSAVASSVPTTVTSTIAPTVALVVTLSGSKSCFYSLRCRSLSGLYTLTPAPLLYSSVPCSPSLAQLSCSSFSPAPVFSGRHMGRPRSNFESVESGIKEDIIFLDLIGWQYLVTR